MLVDFIEANHLHAKILGCGQTVHTAKEAATLMKVPPEQILKSIVLLDENASPYLVLLPGNKQASFPKLKAFLKVKKMRLATPEEVLDMTGYAIGGVPPISVYGVQTILDTSFESFKHVLAGGGDDSHLLFITLTELKQQALDLHIADISE